MAAAYFGFVQSFWYTSHAFFDLLFEHSRLTAVKRAYNCLKLLYQLDLSHVIVENTLHFNRHDWLTDCDDSPTPTCVAGRDVVYIKNRKIYESTVWSHHRSSRML